MDTSWMRWLLVGQDILLFIVPALIVARVKSKQPMQWLRLQTFPSVKLLLLSILLMLVAQPAINLLAWINEQISLPSFMADLEAWMQQMEQANAATTQALMNTHSWGEVAANILVVGLLAGLSEEILFRGAVQGFFAHYEHRATPHIAIWITAILFSMMHLQFYGFIPRMLMGAVFGYVLVWSGSLWTPIAMHATNNTLVVILYAIYGTSGDMQTRLESLGRESTWWVGCLSLMATIGILYLIRLLRRV